MKAMQHSFWRIVWWLCIWTHEHIRCEHASPSRWYLCPSECFWLMWWRVASRWVWPYMYRAKAEGKEFAQPFAEGMDAVRLYR